jgi:DNA-binding FadR family transcriptional regulator
MSAARVLRNATPPGRENVLPDQFVYTSVASELPRVRGRSAVPPGRSLNEMICDYVKHYILERGLVVGAPLPSESQLAQMLGVARSSVREAIKALESLGIIEIRHGDGLYVREYNYDPVVEVLKYGMRFDATTLSELLQIRMWLEKSLIKDVADQVGPKEIQELDRQVVEWRARIQRDLAAVDLEERFHRTLYSIIGNRVLVKILEVFWLALEHAPIAPHREPQVVLDNHIDILETLKEHNPVSAWQAVLRDLLQMQDSILATMK